MTPVKICIPVYKTDLLPEEWYSLDQCFRILGNHPIVFVRPEGLDLAPLADRYGSDRYSEEVFDPGYFTGMKGYNRLMLSAEFYDRFSDTEYILIYQTDACVFRDELLEWVGKGYDYIGAPWLPKPKYLRWPYRLALGFKCAANACLNRDHPIRLTLRVGNGGFSLRRTAAFREVIARMQPRINYYLAHNERAVYSEDVFWSREARLNGRKFRIPSYREAAGFATEAHLDTSMILNGQRLPFGCHAWYKPLFVEFWRPYIDFYKE